MSKSFRYLPDGRHNPDKAVSSVGLSKDAVDALRLLGCNKISEIRKALADKEVYKYAENYVIAEINAFLNYQDAIAEAYKLRRRAARLLKSTGSILGKATSESADRRSKRERAEYARGLAYEIRMQQRDEARRIRKEQYIPPADVRPIKINGKTELAKGDVKIRSYKPEELTKSGHIKKSVLKQEEQVDEVYKRLRALGVELED